MTGTPLAMVPGFSPVVRSTRMQGGRHDEVGHGSRVAEISVKIGLAGAWLALWLVLGCSEQHDATAGQPEPGSDTDARAVGAEAPGAPAPPGGCAGLPEAVRTRWIAFDSNRDDRSNRDIYVMRADGSERTRLTQGPGMEREPVISPDGTRLAYVSEHDDVALIYIYDFRSGELRQLTRWPEQTGRSDWFADNPAWFPDSKRLAFHRGRTTFVIDSDGGPEHPLAVGPDANEAPWDGYKNPVVTPDGREVVCDIWDQIHAFDVQTGARRRIVSSREVRAEAPSLSPDGSQFVYSTVCQDSFLQLALAPTSGGRFEPCKKPLLTPTDGSRAINAAWGPGDYIAYERDPDEGGYASSIALVRRGAAPCVFDSAGAHEANPAWAPADFALPAGFSPF
jgi:Tol biopolymer transport system component